MSDDEYVAAAERVAVFDRSHRTRLLVSGRAPGKMLNGILTGTIPAPPSATAPDVLGGMATYHAVLTPKGKMLSDLWCFCRAETETAVDVPVAGRDTLLSHLRNVLPPRMAKVEDVSDATAAISVVGPTAASHVSRLALGLRVEDHELSGLAEGAWRMVHAARRGGTS